MATRIKDGIIPYTGGIGIEITKNHVINVLLRELNNLIHVNEDRELYVDLQLDDGILPEDDFPVGVTTGKILEEDGWQQSGIIINWKTTSGDYVRIIYANDGNLYYDPGTGAWILIGQGGVTINVATAVALGVIKLGSDTQQTETAQNPTAVQGRTYPLQLNADNQAVVNIPWEEYMSLVEEQGGLDESLVTTGEKWTWNHKQDKLIPGTRITIDQNNVISADITGVFVYKGNVPGPEALPQTGNTVGDVWITEGTWKAYAWNGSRWIMIGGLGIDLSNYFNKTVDDSDDITQGTTNLFVTQAEKTRWNNKQDKIIAGRNITINADGKTINAVDTTYDEGDGIDITNEVITNTKPFDPENEGAAGQYLRKTTNGKYRWSTLPTPSGGDYTAGEGIEIDDNEIINTLPFKPTNEGRSGYVLKRSPLGYYWGPGGNDFAPENAGVDGQVLTKTPTGYAWLPGQSGGNSNVKCFAIADSDDLANAQLALNWLNSGKMPILEYTGTFGYQQRTGKYFFYPVIDTESGSNYLVFQAISTSNNAHINSNGFTQILDPYIQFTLSGNTVTGIFIGTAQASRMDYLSPTVNYGSLQGVAEYEPLYPGSPATKKYVDERGHKFAPVTLNYASNLSVNMSQSLNYVLTLTGDCTLSFSNLIPGLVYQIAVIQDATGGHRLTLPNGFLYASGYAQDTTANSVSKLILDYVGGNYFASITRYS